MRIHGKYIGAWSMMLLFSVAGFAQTTDQEKQETQASDHSEIKKLPEIVAGDWKDIYRDNAALFFDQALMGRETGVYTSRNGYVGNAGVMMLRGISTVNLSSAPYIIVDGVPVRQVRSLNPFVSGLTQSNIGFISPLDVANVRVLRDGYESSMWGGRAGNGIIDVEIDKGVLGSASIDLIARVGVTHADYSYEVMNSTNFRGYLYEYMQLMGKTLKELESNILFDPTHKKYNHNTDWLDEFQKNSLFQDYQLKMKGGDGDTRYMFSLGYASQGENIKEAKYQRFNMRFNLDYKITQKISISNYLSYAYGTSRFFGEGTDWDVNPIYLALTKAPFMSCDEYDDNGIRAERLAEKDVLGKSNPAVFKDNLKMTGNENRVDGVIKARWQMNKQMGLSTYFSASYNNAIEQMNRLSYGIVADENRERQNSKRNYSDYVLRWDTYYDAKGNIIPELSYFGKAGFVLETEEEKMTYGRRINPATDDFETLDNGTMDSITNMNFTHNMLSFYANGKLNYRNRVTAGANVRVESSSNFGKAGRWTLYGGVDLGINLLRTAGYQADLYANWGRTGNNDIRGFYQHTLYFPTSYLGYGGVYLGNVKNGDLKPEITNNYEAGVNARLFGDVLEFSAGYYYRKTTGLLTQKAVAVEIGLDPQFENNGDVVNQGVEVAVNANIVNTGKVKWAVFANISTLNNEVKKLRNGDIINTMDKFTGIAREGEKIGSFYGYKVLGVLKNDAEVKGLKRADGSLYQAGDYRMQDLNGDGVINSKDMQIIGSPLPEFYGGFGSSVSYKGLALSVLFSYSYGNDVYNLLDQKMHAMEDMSNQSVDVMHRWVSAELPGNGELPRAAYGDPSGNFNTSDKWVEDGSYLRLKNLSLSYRIPLKKTTGFFKGLDVFVNCNNLFTVSGYKGFDPEVFSSVNPLLRGVDTGACPNPQSYIFGVKISL